MTPDVRIGGGEIGCCDMREDDEEEDAERGGRRGDLGKGKMATISIFFINCVYFQTFTIRLIKHG